MDALPLMKDPSVSQAGGDANALFMREGLAAKVLIVCNPTMQDAPASQYLRYADADARKMESAFISLGYRVCLCRGVTSAELQAIGRVFSQSGIRRLVFHFVGHGSQADGEVMMGLADGAWWSLHDWLQVIQGRAPEPVTAICFLHTCRTELRNCLRPGTRPGHGQILPRTNFPEVYAICCCQPGQAIHDNSLFAYTLAEVLLIPNLSLLDIFGKLDDLCSRAGPRLQFFANGGCGRRIVLNHPPWLRTWGRAATKASCSTCASLGGSTCASLDDLGVLPNHSWAQVVSESSPEGGGAVVSRSFRPPSSAGNEMGWMRVASVPLDGVGVITLDAYMSIVDKYSAFEVYIMPEVEAVVWKDGLLPEGWDQIGPCLRLYPEKVRFAPFVVLHIPLPSDVAHWPLGYFTVQRKELPDSAAEVLTNFTIVSHKLCITLDHFCVIAVGLNRNFSVNRMHPVAVCVQPLISDWRDNGALSYYNLAVLLYPVACDACRRDAEDHMRTTFSGFRKLPSQQIAMRVPSKYKIAEPWRSCFSRGLQCIRHQTCDLPSKGRFENMLVSNVFFSQMSRYDVFKAILRYGSGSYVPLSFREPPHSETFACLTRGVSQFGKFIFVGLSCQNYEHTCPHHPNVDTCMNTKCQAQWSPLYACINDRVDLQAKLSCCNNFRPFCCEDMKASNVETVCKQARDEQKNTPPCLVWLHYSGHAVTIDNMSAIAAVDNSKGNIENLVPLRDVQRKVAPASEKGLLITTFDACRVPLALQGSPAEVEFKRRLKEAQTAFAKTRCEKLELNACMLGCIADEDGTGRINGDLTKQLLNALERQDLSLYRQLSLARENVKQIYRTRFRNEPLQDPVLEVQSASVEDLHLVDLM